MRCVGALVVGLLLCFVHLCSSGKRSRESELATLKNRWKRATDRSDTSLVDLVKLGLEIQELVANGGAPAEFKRMGALCYERALMFPNLRFEQTREIRFHLREMYVSQLMFDKALSMLEEDIVKVGLDDRPDDSKIQEKLYFQKSELLLKSGNRKGALEWLLKAIEVSESPGQNVLYAFSLWSREKFEKNKPTGCERSFDWYVEVLRKEAESRFSERGLDQTIHEATLYYGLFNIFDLEARSFQSGSVAQGSLSREAWRFLSIGSKITRKYVDLDLKEFRSQHLLIKSIFKPAFIEQLRSAGVGYVSQNGNRLVLVVGLPRSGSTLLEYILTAHPKLTGLGEESELLFFLDRFRNKLVQREKESKANDLVPWLERNAEKFFRELSERKENEKFGNNIFIDKMLFHYMNIGLIYLAFPQVKVLHIFKKNYNDAVFSLLKRQFPPNTAPWSYSLDEIAQAHAIYSDLMDHWRSTIPKETFLDLPYEDLVENFDQSARKVLDFIGVNWDPAVLNFSMEKKNQERTILTHSASQVINPIDTKSLGQWELYRSFMDKRSRHTASSLGDEVCV